MKTYLFTIALSCFFILTLEAQPEFRRIDQYLDLINATYSGDSARQTTAFVSERWRLPDNAGFDASIYYVKGLLERAGFVESDQPVVDQMTYRIEKYPMRLPAWEPQSARVQIMGETEPLLDFTTNRNMIAINSFSTPEDGLEAEVVYHTDADRIDKVSAQTLKNVGCSALAFGFLLEEGTASVAEGVLTITRQAAMKRLDAEKALSETAVKAGEAVAGEIAIISSWLNWYRAALPKVSDMLVEEMPDSLNEKIEEALIAIRGKGQEVLRGLKK